MKFKQLEPLAVRRVVTLGRRWWVVVLRWVQGAKGVFWGAGNILSLT